MKPRFKSIMTAIIIIVAILLMFSFVSDIYSQQTEVKYSRVIEYFEDDIVVSFVVNGKNVLELTTLTPELDSNNYYKKDAEGNYILQRDQNGNPIYSHYTYHFSRAFQIEEICRIADEKMRNEPDTVLESYNLEPVTDNSWWQMLLPYLIIAVVFFFIWFFLMRQAPGGGKMNSFAKSKAKTTDDKNPIRFDDVAGADEEKAELEEVVEFLKDPAKFVKLGARIPRGVLLVGPPGTGKTLLAKAVAGEAGVPFFSISGSDFVEMYVGVGASRVRDLFENARKTTASIIFIDEIDAVGRHRGSGLGGGHDEREQTLNQLLVEMDGFGTSSGVIVIAATNRPDILDPALLRPGRFDRRVTVNYPDIKGREAILKVHCRNKPLEESVNLHKIAQTTIGFTGAELANLMNEAALLAAKKNKVLIGMDDIEESYMKLLLGPQKKVKVRTDEDNRLCAYHEAGHAVASYFCKHTDPIKHITIIPAGMTGGVTLSVPTEDRLGISRNQMLDRIVMSLGGRAAEEIVLDDISTGASNDIQQATRIARNMVTRYGMSAKLGTVLYGSEHSEDAIFLGRDFSNSPTYSEKTAADIDDEIRTIIGDSYDRCKAILAEHIDKLHFVASFLLEYEIMDEEQFRAAMEMDNPTNEAIIAIAKEKEERSAEENRTAHEENLRIEEENRRRAEQAARIARENSGNTNQPFSPDEFFRTVFRAPDNPSNNNQGSNDAQSSNDTNEEENQDENK